MKNIDHDSGSINDSIVIPDAIRNCTTIILVEVSVKDSTSTFTGYDKKRRELSSVKYNVLSDNEFAFHLSSKSNQDELSGSVTIEISKDKSMIKGIMNDQQISSIIERRAGESKAEKGYNISTSGALLLREWVEALELIEDHMTMVIDTINAGRGGVQARKSKKCHRKRFVAALWIMLCFTTVGCRPDKVDESLEAAEKACAES